MGRWSALCTAMRTAPASSTDRREVDQWLEGDPANPGPAGLRHLLAAARAPAQRGELADESAVLPALVRAYRASGPETGHSTGRRVGRAVSRAVTVKIVAALALLLLGGTALAAAGGSLPGPVQQRAHDLFSSLGVPAPGRSSGTSRTGRPSPSATPTENPGATPPAATAALCWTWVQAQDGGGHGKAVDPAVRHALAVAAGGESRITAFCTGLLGLPSAPASPSPPPSAGTNSNGNGNGKGHGQGRPTSSPHH